MAFDECPPYPSTREYATKSMHLTHRWLERCVQFMKDSEPKYGYSQAMFPIVQGSSYDDLRKESCEFIASQGQPGNAIGGLSVGEPVEDMYRISELCCDILPKDKPRYLMGVGTPVNILECIDRGVDMFDCVLPTRNARHGMVYTAEGIMNMKNAKWKNDFDPLDSNPGVSSTSRFYSRAYVSHLIRCNEMLGRQITSIHNLSFYLWLVKEARKHIVQGDFKAWKEEMIPKLGRKA
jgi:queuine tRNA-ribosyltransferase